MMVWSLFDHKRMGKGDGGQWMFEEELNWWICTWHKKVLADDRNTIHSKYTLFTQKMFDSHILGCHLWQQFAISQYVTANYAVCTTGRGNDDLNTGPLTLAQSHQMSQETITYALNKNYHVQ